MPDSEISGPVNINRPDAGVPKIPLLFDSPHSGNNFPEDMRPIIDIHSLRKNEDAFIDELFSSATDFGATFIRATFPRTYCDTNRSEFDVDPDALDGDWKLPAEPSVKLRTRGAGVVPTKSTV